MIIRIGHNEYLITPDSREIEIFFRGEPVGIVRIDDVKNCVFTELIDAYYDELREVLNEKN